MWEAGLEAMPVPVESLRLRLRIRVQFRNLFLYLRYRRIDVNELQLDNTRHSIVTWLLLVLRLIYPNYNQQRSYIIHVGLNNWYISTKRERMHTSCVSNGCYGRSHDAVASCKIYDTLHRLLLRFLSSWVAAATEIVTKLHSAASHEKYLSN